MTIIKVIGRAVGVDADDVKVIATTFIVALVLGLLLVILAAAAGVAVVAFDAACGC